MTRRSDSSGAARWGPWTAACPSPSSREAGTHYTPLHRDIPRNNGRRVVCSAAYSRDVFVSSAPPGSRTRSTGRSGRAPKFEVQRKHNNYSNERIHSIRSNLLRMSCRNSLEILHFFRFTVQRQILL